MRSRKRRNISVKIKYALKELYLRYITDRKIESLHLMWSHLFDGWNSWTSIGDSQTLNRLTSVQLFPSQNEHPCHQLLALKNILSLDKAYVWVYPTSKPLKQAQCLYVLPVTIKPWILLSLLALENLLPKPKHINSSTSGNENSSNLSLQVEHLWNQALRFDVLVRISFTTASLDYNLCLGCYR